MNWKFKNLEALFLPLFSMKVGPDNSKTIHYSQQVDLDLSLAELCKIILQLYRAYSIFMNKIKAWHPIHLYLIFEKSSWKKSSSTTWIFCLFQTQFLLLVSPAKINLKINFCMLKVQFVKLDFWNLSFQKSSTDG